MSQYQSSPYSYGKQPTRTDAPDCIDPFRVSAVAPLCDGVYQFVWRQLPARVCEDVVWSAEDYSGQWLHAGSEWVEL